MVPIVGARELRRGATRRWRRAGRSPGAMGTARVRYAGDAGEADRCHSTVAGDPAARAILGELTCLGTVMDT
jgi:hypothetical protein